MRKYKCPECNEEMFIVESYDSLLKITNSEEISLCSSCNCMTKTIKNKCGKCKNDK